MKEKRKLKSKRELEISQRHITSIKNKRSIAGITLIALVLTIIVLLILAGVSIAMLTGENGILTQAQSAKTRTDKANIIEQVRTDILGKQAENNSGDVFASDLEEILKKYFSNDEANIKNIVEGTTGEGEETKLISKEDSNIKIDLSEIYSGEIKKVILAKDVLIPNEKGATAEEKSPYVLYNNLLCRAFYNDDAHGLQIITNDNVTNVTLGYDDPTVTADDFAYNGSLELDDNFKKAAASYNNAVDTLNNKAKEYMGTKAIDARSVGSTSTLKNGKFQGDTSNMWSSDEQFMIDYSLNGIFKQTQDPSPYNDLDRYNDLGIKATSDTWFTSRYRGVQGGTKNYSLGIYYLKTSSTYLSSDRLCYVNSNGNMSYASETYGLRPIFLLPTDTIISSGDGSEENPYVIE